MALKQVFLNRVRNRLYVILRNQYLKGWDVSEIYDFADALIADNKETINQYLSNNQITLGNINGAIDDLILHILIPSIKEIK
jgi:hypothetical protein